jgi:hypothetical protein
VTKEWQDGFFPLEERELAFPTTNGARRMEIKFRVSDDIRESAERVRASGKYSSLQECLIGLILDADERVSGRDKSAVQAAIMTDARVGGAISNALVELRRALEFPEISCSPIQTCIDEAIESLKFSQTVILEAQATRIPAADKPTAERLRIRGGGDDWKAAERS